MIVMSFPIFCFILLLLYYFPYVHLRSLIFYLLIVFVFGINYGLISNDSQCCTALQSPACSLSPATSVSSHLHEPALKLCDDMMMIDFVRSLIPVITIINVETCTHTHQRHKPNTPYWFCYIVTPIMKKRKKQTFY